MHRSQQSAKPKNCRDVFYGLSAACHKAVVHGQRSKFSVMSNVPRIADIKW